MVRKLLSSAAAAVLLAALSAHPPVVEVCSGFLPENDLRIPVSVQKGIQQAEFNAVLDGIEKIYQPIVAAKGGVLEVKRLWEDETVNAYAQRQGDRYIISMFGGLARHAAVTQDGFALVACHEMSHHLGGAPKSSGWFSSWATIEGQSDYAANLKCLRRVFADSSSAEFTRPKVEDPLAVEACAKAFSEPADRAVCLRGAMAGKSVTALFQALHQEEKAPAFDTPDPTVVAAMLEKHPPTQCRLDTYLQGSICGRPVSADVDDKDLFAGTCNRKNGDGEGLRPRCWYKPPAAEPQLMSLAPVMAGSPKAFSAPGSAFSALQSEELWKGL